MICELQDKVFESSPRDFDVLALEIFRYQYSENKLYKAFIDNLRIDHSSIKNIHSIPFLPVGFFKDHKIVSGDFTPETIFTSSGTTQTGNSQHYIRSVDHYKRSFLKAFNLFYGSPENWCILGLLPSYLERQDSSLVMMVNELIIQSRNAFSGFYLYDHASLANLIRQNELAAKKTLLIGVTFALLDFAEHFTMPLLHTTIMETGGMKGKRKEITRPQVHEILKGAWQVESIHSEYGMTELLSQAYSFGEGLFRCPPWMKVVMRDEDDPLSSKQAAESHPVNGLVNVIDLANTDSCCFVATDDIGKLHPDGSFEVMGRADGSDIRGCSLMYAG